MWLANLLVTRDAKAKRKKSRARRKARGTDEGRRKGEEMSKGKRIQRSTTERKAVSMLSPTHPVGMLPCITAGEMSKPTLHTTLDLGGNYLTVSFQTQELRKLVNECIEVTTIS